jgi:SAM-dependent methyltransferase
MNDAEFDQFDSTYKAEMDKSISFAGQSHDFFMRAKVECIVDLASRYYDHPGTLSILDFGCGVGLTSSMLVPYFARVTGVDVSEKLVARARQAVPAANFSGYDGTRIPADEATFDIVVAVNVFHHIVPEQRDALIADIYRVLKPGGMFVILEHNPWNPLTLKAVRNCAFDVDAILLKRSESKVRLRRAGFAGVASRFIIFVPFAGWLHCLTMRCLGWLPLGAQYWAAGFKP